MFSATASCAEIATQQTQRKLPQFFPLVDRKRVCKEVGQNFFDCFSAKGKQEEGVRDANKGQEGLNNCLKELDAYESCMIKQNIGKNMRLIRAPEAYLAILSADEKR